MSTPTTKTISDNRLGPAPPAQSTFVAATTSVTSWFNEFNQLVSVTNAASNYNKASSSSEERQQTVAGLGEVVPVIFGTDTIGGAVSALIISGGYLYLRVTWCVGPCQSIETVLMGGETVPAGITRTDYLGTAAQTVDTVLQDAFSAEGKTYFDTLPGICYSVFKIPSRALDGFPEFTAKIKGLKVKASSVATPAWSVCPAYCIAAFVENGNAADILANPTLPKWGMGRTIDWDSVATVATLNNDTSIGEARRTLNLSMIESMPDVDWLQTLCGYAGCWFSDEGGTIRLIPDTTGASVATFTSANIVDGTFRARKAGPENIPTVMRVQYTDTTTKPWSDGEAVVYAAGVLAGTTPWRESSVPMPGLNRYSQAMREATERINALTLRDLSVSFKAFDEGLKFQQGDIVTVTDPIGVTDKLMRIDSVRMDEPGRYQLDLTEYDAAVYSNLVVAEPSTVDTTVPLPTNPPTVTGVTAAEETYTLETGLFAARGRITWTATTWPFVSQFKIVVRVATTEIYVGYMDPGSSSYVTPPLQEGNTYTIAVTIMSTAGVSSTEAIALLTVYGKAIVPGNVLTLTGFEVGGRVFLSWTRADNPTSPGTPDPDVWRYEIRRGTVSQAWGDTGVTVLDQTDGLRVVDEGAPAGTWRYHVKAIDSVGQYSTTAKTLDVTVTTDASSFLVDSYDHTAPRWQNLLTYSQAFNSWTNSSPAVTVTSDSTAAPDGTTTADTLADSSSSYCYLQSNVVTAASAGEVCCAILRVKKDSTGSATRAALLRLYFSGSHSVDLVFDTSTGATHARVVGSAVVDASGSYDYGGGYWAFWISGHHASIAASNTAIYPAVGANATLSALTYSATTQGSIIAWGAQLVRSTYPAMYAATTSTADTTSGGYGMEAYTLAPTDPKTYYVTEDFIPFGTKYTNNLDTYTSTTGELSETHASMTSRWVGEAEDWGQTLSGQWTGTADITDVNGSHTSYFEYSTDGTTYTSVSGLSQKVTGRFARMKHEATTTSTMLVTVPTQNIRLDAIPRTENGSTTSLNPGPRTVTMANTYVAVKKLTVTPIGNTSLLAIADNINLAAKTFDIYVFTSSTGVQAAAGVTVYWEFEGI